MLHSSTKEKKTLISTAAASFVGILAAVPLVASMYSPNNGVSALEGQTSATSSQSTGAQADYAKFVYAYNQGYLASAESGDAKSTVSLGGGSCTEPDMEQAAAGGMGAGGGAVSTVSMMGAPSMRQVGGRGNVTPPAETASAWHAYYSYMSQVYNSSSSIVNHTNSHNTVGSNNSTSTEISVEDAKNVDIGVNNETTTTNTSIDDSFNEDSYNTTTETNTTIVNDSFNHEVTNTDNSVNTEDSFNNETSTEINDSNNTTTTETTTETNIDVEVGIEDSFNTTTDGWVPPGHQDEVLAA